MPTTMTTHTATFLHMEMIDRLSALGYMVVQDDDEGEVRLLCELSGTCRAMQSAFGGGDIRGKARLKYQLDEMGTLYAIEPEDA
jgi:hypothetical protein